MLKNIDKAETTKLNPIMGKALLVVSGIEQALADPTKAQALGQSFGFDLSKIPPGMDVFAMLAETPASDPGQDDRLDRHRNSPPWATA